MKFNYQSVGVRICQYCVF